MKNTAFIPVLLLLSAALCAGSIAQAADTRAQPAAAASPWAKLDPSKLRLHSKAALVVDQTGHRVYEKDADQPVPIASITKLMTAMVVLDAGVPLDVPLTVSKEDRDEVKLTGSRLDYGNATLSRREMLRLALMSSENRAAAALGRTTFPGGSEPFVKAMNRKAAALGMTRSRFADASGLDVDNQSTAADLVKMLRAAQGYPLIREATTTESADVRPYKGRGPLHYVNTNRLIRNESWDILLSKTGYINEAGRCLVMATRMGERTLYIVLLNSYGKLTPFGDSNRLRKWIQAG